MEDIPIQVWTARNFDQESTNPCCYTVFHSAILRREVLANCKWVVFLTCCSTSWWSPRINIRWMHSTCWLCWTSKKSGVTLFSRSFSGQKQLPLCWCTPTESNQQSNWAIPPTTNLKSGYRTSIEWLHLKSLLILLMIHEILFALLGHTGSIIIELPATLNDLGTNPDLRMV